MVTPDSPIRNGVPRISNRQYEIEPVHYYVSVFEMSSFPWNPYPCSLLPDMVVVLSAPLAMNEMLHSPPLKSLYPLFLA